MPRPLPGHGDDFGLGRTWAATGRRPWPAAQRPRPVTDACGRSSTGVTAFVRRRQGLVGAADQRPRHRVCACARGVFVWAQPRTSSGVAMASSATATAASADLAPWSGVPRGGAVASVLGCPQAAAPAASSAGTASFSADVATRLLDSVASSTGRPAPRHRPVMPWPCPKQGHSLLAQRPWAPAPFDVITALVRRCCAVASPASSGTSLAPQPALVASLAVLFDLVYFAALSFMQTGASAHTPAPALLFSCNFQTDTHTSLPTQNSNKEVSFVVRIALKEYPGQIRELE